MKDEVNIVRLLKQRNLTAFSDVYNLYAPSFYQMIIKLTPDPAIAAHILEEIFVDFWKDIHVIAQKKETVFILLLRLTYKHCMQILGLSKEKILQSLATSLPSSIPDTPIR
jgi:DNA-directed RNA polymerase specialized sigma24 family protein